MGKSKKMIDLSISIVNYKTKNFLKKCLNSIYKNTQGIDYEVFVIDNASRDSSERLLRELKRPFGCPNSKLKIILNKKNLGFAKAHNLALKKAKGKYLLLLNPDTEIKKDTFLKMINFMEKNPQIGILSPKIIEPDWRIGPVARGKPSVFFGFLRFSELYRFFPKLTEDYYKDLTKYDKTQEVESVGGTCFMIKRKVLEKIGFLDESFFLYFEDFDYCQRAKKAGFKIYYLPKATIFHHFGESSKQNYILATSLYFNSMKRLYQKHFSKEHTSLFNFLAYLGFELFKIKEIVKRSLSKNKKVG